MARLLTRAQSGYSLIATFSLSCNLSRQSVLCILSLRPPKGCTLIFVAIAGVHFHELGDVELWLLQDLHLPDHYILQWKDALGLLFDLLADGLWDQLLDEVAELDLVDLVLDDLHHPKADLANLCRLRIAIRLHLIVPFLGKSDDEEADHVSVCSLHIRIRLDQGMPFPNQ